MSDLPFTVFGGSQPDPRFQQGNCQPEQPNERTLPVPVPVSLAFAVLTRLQCHQAGGFTPTGVTIPGVDLSAEEVALSNQCAQTLRLYIAGETWLPSATADSELPTAGQMGEGGKGGAV